MSSDNTEANTFLAYGIRPNQQIIVEQSTNTNLESDEDEDSMNIMCIMFQGGKVSAAYYNYRDKMLYVYEEMPDFHPDYLVATSIYREIKPKYLVSFGNVTEDFIKILVDLINDIEDNTVTTNTVRSIPENMSLLSLKYYPYNICKLTVSNLKLMSNRNDNCGTRNEVHIHSRINFDEQLTIHALGALLSFLEKNWSALGIAEKDSLQYLDLVQISRKNHVLMDNEIFRALQVFSQRGHDANVKHGTQSSSREAISIFKLFSAKCKSGIGLITLKNLFMNPIYDLEILNKRLDFVEFIIDPKQREFVDALQENIRFLTGDLNIILTKIMNSRANSTDWYNLYQTIYHTIVINDISAPYKGFLAILNELSNTVTQDLIGLGNAIENALDFRDRSRNSRPTIRFGLDEELDAKKLRQQDISKDVIAAARLAVDSLPQFLEECSVIYLPEMGYLIGINKWDENCYPEELEKLGFSFVFTLKDMFLYKNPLCAELDRRLGDITGEIIDHENRIVRRLAGFICKHNRDIRDPLKIIGLIDCLISIAKVSLNNSFVRPKLNTESIFEISGSRHPLMEQLISQYQPNDFFSGGPYSRMKIITGPNGSGKSIYLKQVALITFLAHTGSYVPAEKANIGLIGSFYSRLMATESASIRLSSFMIDITQMTRALNANSNSLILLDEFGRGTTEEDGMSILGGVLKYFLNSEKGCPHILVSTHFQQMITYLPETPLIECQQMTYTKEDGGIYFLYKLAKGISKSYALDVAESIGLDKDLIARAREILDCLQNNRQIEPLPEFKAKLDLIEHLTHLEIPE